MYMETVSVELKACPRQGNSHHAFWQFEGNALAAPELMAVMELRAVVMVVMVRVGVKEPL
jgi:hypothetical protein